MNLICGLCVPSYRLRIAILLLLLLALYTATWPRARLLHADLAVKSSETLLNRTLGEERGLSHTNSNARFTLLVFSKTAAYRHASISAGKELLQQLATDNNFAVQFSEDANSFTDAALAEVDGVLFLNTTGNILNSEQQTAFERFIQAGNGYIGVHSASDTEYDWSWYGKLVGAYFDSHPAIQDATVTIRDTHHPSTTMLPDPWLRRDEWYNFQSQPQNVTVLLAVDEASYKGGVMGADHPIAWYHNYDGGRSWYTAMGHTVESFAEPFFQQHLLGGILWAVGEVATAPPTATATPTAIVPTATPTPTLSSPPTAMPLEVVQYMLVDAETDQDIGPLTDGTVLDLAALPIAGLNIRADTDPAVVGSLRFDLNQVPYFRIEHLPPYAVLGDARGDYMPWHPTPQIYTLTAIPYSQPMVTGTVGISKAITFIVTDTTLAGAVGVSTLSPIASLPANLTAGLNGVLYLDENRNGEVETTEPPLPNLQLRIQSTVPISNTVREVQTDVNGRYAATELTPGYYRITPILPVDLLTLRPTTGDIILYPGGTLEMPDFMIIERTTAHMSYVPLLVK